MSAAMMLLAPALFFSVQGKLFDAFVSGASSAWALAAFASIGALLLLLSAIWTRRRAREARACKLIEADPGQAELEQIYHQYSVSDTQGRRLAGAMNCAAGSGSAQDAFNGSIREAKVAWLERLGQPPIKIPGDRAMARIGRHSMNDIVLPDSSVHRHHAELAISELGRFELTDLGGANGCIVNGERCQRRELADGDTIELGEVKLKFRTAARG